MKAPKKSLKVTIAGKEPFKGRVAWKVFIAVLASIDIEKVAKTRVWSVEKKRPEGERGEFYAFVDGWWVRKHSSVDTMVGVLTRLGTALGIKMTIEAVGPEQSLLS